MSQEITFSISSEQLDRHRQDDRYTQELLNKVAEVGDGIEYVNSELGEYSSDIKSDIEYAQQIGLNPETIHLSRLEELDEPEGYTELNTSYHNSQISYDPRLGTLEPFWNPDNLVFHPPILENGDDKKEVMNTVIENMHAVNKLNHSDERISGNLLIENMPPVHHTDYMISKPSDIHHFEEIATNEVVESDIQYVLDTGHTADCIEMAQSMPSERVQEVHLHNKAKRDDGGWDNHLPPSEGLIDMEEFLNFYQEELSHADLVLEIKPSEMTPESLEESYDFVQNMLDG